MVDQSAREAIFNRFVGSLVGMVVGDALALPAAGLTPYTVHKKYQWLDAYYDDAGRKGGEYSCVSKISLSIAKAISDTKSVDSKAIADAQSQFVGEPGLDRVSFESLTRYVAGLPWDKSGDLESVSHEFLPRLVPVGIYAAATGHDDVELARLCRTACGVTHQSKQALLAGWVVAKVIRDAIRGFRDLTNPYEWYQSDKSVMARIVSFTRKVEVAMGTSSENSLAERLLFTRRRIQDGTSVQEFAGLVGNRSGVAEILPFSIFCFMRNPDSFNAVTNAATMGGAANYNAALVGAMTGAFSGFQFVPEKIRQSTHNISKVVLLGERMGEVLLNETRTPSIGA